jgi:hypothetical protein
MNKERKEASRIITSQWRQSFLKRIQQVMSWGAVAQLALALPGTLRAEPIVVRIDDKAFGLPQIEVQGAPAGYNIHTGALVNNLSQEDGALITLLGVDTSGTVPSQGWRFIDPRAPDPTHAAADIVWIEHDFDFFGDGSLRVGFNSHFPGGWYTTPPPNPPPGADKNAGPVRPYWVTVYSSPSLVVQFKGPSVPGR